VRVLATVSDQAWGGKHRYMYGVLGGLARLGHRVVVLAERGGRMAGRCAAGGVLAVVDCPPFGSEPESGPDAGADEAVVRAVRQEAPDVLIASGRRDLMAVHRARAALASPQPVVFFRHSAFPLAGAERAPEVLSGVTHLVGTSRAQIEHQLTPLVEAGAIPAAKVSLIPSGVPADLPARVAAYDEVTVRRQLGIDPEAFVFLSLARLSWEKGLAQLVDAFASLGDRESVLVVAGEGPDRTALEAAVAGLGLTRRVLFLGHVDDVEPLLSVANTVVLASVVPETGPLALKEAMAAGKPVIAPAIGGIPEFVESGRSGLLFQPGDTASLAAAMRRLCDEEDLGGHLGRAAARTIAGGHLLERRVDHLAWLLDLLLLRTTPRAALLEQQWNTVRLRGEERFTYLFVPETSQLTELPHAAADVVRQSLSRADPGVLADLDEPLRGEIVVRLFQMGALRRAAEPRRGWRFGRAERSSA
jgi:glycosyltransferase involved in cell wall biosynthesis